MMLSRTNLGLVPAWQYSSDPAVNINLNPHVVFPPGWNQLTVQPQGQWITPEAGAPLTGVFDSWAWTNRKWLVLGGVGLLAGALAIGATAVLR